MKIWTYKHYKWKMYNVLWLTLHSETREKLVLYKCLYEVNNLWKEYWSDPYFVRPYDNFNEKILIDWKQISRFEYIWNKKYETI